MITDFLPDEILNAWIPKKQIDKLFKVDGINPSSFVGRCERFGKPLLNGLSRSPIRFRASDIISRAVEDGLSVVPYCAVKAMYDTKVLAAEERSLVAKRDALLASVGDLKHNLGISSLSSKITGKTLLREHEIVEGSHGVPRISGIYFLIHLSKVVYVGQSVSVFSRVNDHVTCKTFDSFSFIPCDKSMLDKMESLYIHYLRPPLNGRTTSKDERPCAPLTLQELMSI